MNTSPSTAVVEFHGASLITFMHSGELHVAMKPIAEAIGLDWTAQFRRIRRDDVLSQGIAIMAIPTAGGGSQQHACLPLKFLNGWLFGIDTRRVRPDVRERVVTYKLECHDVLYRHFIPEVAEQFPTTISPAQQNQLQQAVAAKTGDNGGLRAYVWSRFNNHFSLGSYKQLPAARFDEALAYLAAMPMPSKGEEPKAQESPSPVPHDLQQVLVSMVGVLEGVARRIEALEGQVLPPEQTVPTQIPLHDIKDLNFPWESAAPIGGSGHFLTYANSICHPQWQSPTWQLLARLEELGCDVEGCKIEQMAMRFIMGRMMSYAYMKGYDLREGVAYNQAINGGRSARNGPPKSLFAGHDSMFTTRSAP